MDVHSRERRDGQAGGDRSREEAAGWRRRRNKDDWTGGSGFTRLDLQAIFGEEAPFNNNRRRTRGDNKK